MDVSRLCTRLTLLPLSMMVVSAEVCAQALRSTNEMAEKGLDAIVDCSWCGCEENKSSDDEDSDA
jgi:hypothetical protein